MRFIRLHFEDNHSAVWPLLALFTRRTLMTLLLDRLLCIFFGNYTQPAS